MNSREEGIFVVSFASKNQLKTHCPYLFFKNPPHWGEREHTTRARESMNGQDLGGADEDNDGGFEVTVRVYKQEEHWPPDLGFLEGLVVRQGFQQLRRRSTCFQTV
ncbi:hypothetical protein Hanom_Chr03g00203971 [Helianthus anomalus]